MIEVNGIVKKFGRKRVLDGVSFTAQKGDITCLIGINGAGKPTVLNAITGLTPRNGGEIIVNGQKFHKGIFEQVPYIPEAITLRPHSRTEEAMQFMADFYRAWNQARADEM